MKILKVKQADEIKLTDILILPKPNGTVERFVIHRLSQDVETGIYTIKFYGRDTLILTWDSMLLVEEEI